MKKFLRIFIYGISIICIAVTAYFCGVKLAQDDIVFELNYSNEVSSAEYYALKEDNTLVWTWQNGQLYIWDVFLYA